MSAQRLAGHSIARITRALNDAGFRARRRRTPGATRTAAERDARTAEASHAQRRIRELEDELAAARESLRRAIRQANR